MIEVHQGERRQRYQERGLEERREQPFRPRPTSEKGCYERRSKAQFPCCPLTEDDRNCQKDRGLDN